MSPVRIQRPVWGSSTKISFVAPGFFQYPFITLCALVSDRASVREEMRWVRKRAEKKTYLGPCTQISPLSPRFTSWPVTGFTIWAEQFALSSPTEAAVALTVVSQPRREQVPSVMPHPCCGAHQHAKVTGTEVSWRAGKQVLSEKLTLICRSPSGHRASHSLMTSPPNGAAPEPMSVTLLKSYFFVRGDLTKAYHLA